MYEFFWLYSAVFMLLESLDMLYFVGGIVEPKRDQYYSIKWYETYFGRLIERLNILFF
jgi:hypothetical protein